MGNLFNSGGNSNSGSSMMMIVILGLCCCCFLSSAGVGMWYYTHPDDWNWLLDKLGLSDDPNPAVTTYPPADEDDTTGDTPPGNPPPGNPPPGNPPPGNGAAANCEDTNKCKSKTGITEYACPRPWDAKHMRFDVTGTMPRCCKKSTGKIKDSECGMSAADFPLRLNKNSKSGAGKKIQDDLLRIKKMYNNSTLQLNKWQIPCPCATTNAQKNNFNKSVVYDFRQSGSGQPTRQICYGMNKGDTLYCKKAKNSSKFGVETSNLWDNR